MSISSENKTFNDITAALYDLHEVKAMKDIFLIWPDDYLTIDQVAITRLVESWRHHARRLFWDAPIDKSTISATEAMKHSAVLFLNCVDDLLKAIGITSILAPSAKQEGIEQ